MSTLFTLELLNFSFEHIDLHLLLFILYLNFQIFLLLFLHLLLVQHLLVFLFAFILNLILPLNDLVFDPLVLDALCLTGIFYSIEGLVVYLCQLAHTCNHNRLSGTTQRVFKKPC